MSAPLWHLAGLVAAFGFVRYVLRAIFKPKGRCWLCKGTGRMWWSDEDRKADCWLCHGNPWGYTFGARLVRGQVRFRPGRWGK